MADTQTTTNNKSDAEKWQERFQISENAQQPTFRKAEKFYDILYAVFNTDNIAPWRSKVYVPTLASKAWDLISRLSDIQPEFSVTINNELETNDETGELKLNQGVEERATKIEAQLQEDFSCSHGEPMKLKLFNTLVDAVVAGTGFAKVCWTVEKKTRRARPVDGNNLVDLSQEVVKESDEGYNDFQPINFFNVFIEPNATSFADSEYVIVRNYTSKRKAKASGLYDSSKIDDLTVSKPSNSNFSTYNQSRNRALNNRDENDDTVDSVCLYECYSPDGSLTVYGEGKSSSGSDNPNGWIDVGRNVLDQYWHGMYPVVPFYIRKKSFSAYGEGLFENNSRLNSAVNDLFNHYLDNWNLSIDSMLMYEDNTLMNDFVVEPGGEIIYTGSKPDQFKFPEPDPQQLSVVMNVLNQAIESATVPQYLSGVPDSALDKTQGTATGVRNITEAATEKVGFMRDNYKQSMKQVGRIWLSNRQQFMDAPSQLTTLVKGRKVPQLLMPGDMQGEMDLDIDDDSMIPVTKEQRRQTYIDLIGQLAGLQKMGMEQYQLTKDITDVPRYDIMEMAEDLANQFAIKDPQKYFKTDQIQPPQTSVGPSEKIIESLNFKDLPADTQQAFLQQAGLPPSKVLELQQESEMATHAQTVNNATGVTGVAQPQQPQPMGVPVNG